MSIIIALTGYKVVRAIKQDKQDVNPSSSA